MSARYELGEFIAKEALAMLEYEISGLKPLVMKRGTPSVALYVDFDSLGSHPDASSIALAMRPAVHGLARAIKRRHVKRFYRSKPPVPHAEISWQVVSDMMALTFVRFFSLKHKTMVNRLQILGAVRH